MSPRFVLSSGLRVCVWSTFALIASFRASASAQDQAAPAVPATKQLAGADAQRVEELTKTIDQLQRAGKFADADAPAREVYAIYERTLGSDHWRTVDARRVVA